MRLFTLLNALAGAGAALGAPAESNTSSQKHQPATGSGLAYAESCQAKLFAWRSSKTSYESRHGSTSMSIFSSAIPMVSYEPETPTATSLITLCDGHARVVGQWTTHNASSTSYTYKWTNTNPVFVSEPYPTPKPCSINPSDCGLLQSSWTSHWNSLTQASPNYSEGLLAPPCETSQVPQPTYSTNSKGQQCDSCLIAGKQIRLLYWPVTTVAGVGNLCDDKAETVSATATGPLRSVVTEGITITSPTVGISIGGLSRVDDCGTTVDHTIIPVLPEEVSSVNGARALFTHRPFNFADLNYNCLDAPNEEFVTTGTRTDCYQEVPASAYFFGHANAAGANWDAPNAFANRTIWPNYQPQVLPPNTLTAAIRSLWGPDCYIHPDGIWDPPIALQQEASFPLPEYGPGAPTSYYIPHTDAPQPGGPTTPNMPEPTEPLTPTAEAQHEPSAANTGGHSEPTQTGSSSGHNGWGSNGGDASEHGDGSSHGSGSSDDVSSNQGSEQGGGDTGSHQQGSGHEIVYTTIVTHTTAESDGGGGGGQTAGGDDGQGQVYTTTAVWTSQAGSQDDSPRPTGSSEQIGDNDGSNDESDSGSSGEGMDVGEEGGSDNGNHEQGTGTGSGSSEPGDQSNDNSSASSENDDTSPTSSESGSSSSPSQSGSSYAGDQSNDNSSASSENDDTSPTSSESGSSSLPSQSGSSYPGDQSNNTSSASSENDGTSPTSSESGSSSSPSESGSEGSISGAIQSGIRGGQDDSPETQANAAASSLGSLALRVVPFGIVLAYLI